MEEGKKPSELPIQPVPPSNKTQFSVVSGFEWNEQRQKAAIMLATGHSIKETALKAGVSERTI